MDYLEQIIDTFSKVKPSSFFEYYVYR